MFDKEKIKLGINKTLILENSDRFWMITSGEVDIFYALVDENGEYKSSLKHLYRAKQGELLFSLITMSLKSGTKLVAISSEASLIAINKNKLLDINHVFLKQLIDNWISKVTHKLYNSNPPRVYKNLEIGKEVLLKNNDIAYPSRGLVWCHIIEGEISKYSDKIAHKIDSKFNFPIPVSNNLWIKVLNNTTQIKVISTNEILKDEIDFMLSFNSLQDHLYTILTNNAYQQKEEESQRIKDKVTSENGKLANSLSKLKSILSGNKRNNKTETKGETTSNGLFEACQNIGDEVGFTFQLPKFTESYENSTTNQLYAISQASNVRVRKIILRGVWWKEENGHLLAFLKEDKRPISLIQKNATTYILKDALSGKEEIVTNKIAETLDPFCYMFFYGFEEQMTSVKKIWSFSIQGIKKDAKFLILAALAGSIIGLLVPILSGIMFDDVIPTADSTLLFEVFGIMLIIAFATAGLQLVQGILQLRVETKSSINLQAGLMDHLLRLPVSFYKKFTAGDLTNRALSVNAIRQILSNTVMTTVLSGAFSFVNLALLFYYESSLAWIGVGLSLFAILFVASIGWWKLKYDRQIANTEGELQGFLFEFLSGITKIRISGGESRIFTLWADRFSKLKRLGFTSGSYQNYVETFKSSYPLFTNILFFSFIYYMYTNASKSGTVALISVGAFMAFISAFNQFLNDCLRMSMALITSLNIVSLYERVKPILEEIPESSEQSNDPGELAGEIEINSVSFRYQEEQPLVLNNISFRINPGEMVAFVGTSGSGKSTIMRLLLGFEIPELGSIYYDGHAFDTISKDLVRRQIGVVLQNGALMSGSIFKNIVGNSELTLEDAWEAARMAGMEEDIKQMPMEMHTVISEGAGTFSGGQRQRLMIARAIAHKPRLLFMDEATSALDNRTQNIVSESLDKLQATRIVIAHRLSTVINADRIYVLDKGTIVESGNYDELMEKDGIFAKLAKRQIA